MDRIYTPFAIKLHAFGLGRLQDPNWTGLQLFEELKSHVRCRRKPFLLHDFAKQGVLHHIGLWLYEDFVNGDERFEEEECEQLSWYLEDLTSFLIAGSCPDYCKWIRRTQQITHYFDSLYATDEALYYERLDDARRTLNHLHTELIESHCDKIAELAPYYADNYADRVFHDRQLCAFIAELLVTIGFDGSLSDDDNPQQWVDRKSIPSWAKKAVLARDRGKCANCSVDMVLELLEHDHIDHIVPLARGGCNDLVNLQLLCRKCNLAKRDLLVKVNSSVPIYISRRKHSPVVSQLT